MPVIHNNKRWKFRIYKDIEEYQEERGKRILDLKFIDKNKELKSAE